MPPGRSRELLLLRLRRTLRAIRVPTAQPTAIQSDARAGTSDTVALARAARAGRADGRRRRAVGAARGAEGRDIRLCVRAGVLLAGFFSGGQVGFGEAAGEGFHFVGAPFLAADLAGFRRTGWVRGFDLRGAQAAAFRDSRSAHTTLVAGGLGRGAGRSLFQSTGGALGVGDIKDVQLAASRGLSDSLPRRIMGDVVAIDDVVIPVSLALLEGHALEAESTLPPASLGRVLGKRELAGVVVPGTEQVDGLAVGGGAEGEVELNSCHFGLGDVGSTVDS